MSDTQITDPYQGRFFPPLCTPGRQGFIYFIKPLPFVEEAVISRWLQVLPPLTR